MVSQPINPSQGVSISKRHRLSNAAAIPMTANNAFYTTVGYAPHPRQPHDRADSCTPSITTMDGSFASSTTSSFIGRYPSFSSQQSQLVLDPSQLDCNRRHSVSTTPFTRTALSKHEHTPVMQAPAMWCKQECEAAAVMSASHDSPPGLEQEQYHHAPSPSICHTSPMASESTEPVDAVTWVTQPTWSDQAASPPQFITPIWSVHQVPQPSVCDVSFGESDFASSFIGLDHTGLMPTVAASFSSTAGTDVASEYYPDSSPYNTVDDQAIHPYYAPTALPVHNHYHSPRSRSKKSVRGPSSQL